MPDGPGPVGGVRVDALDLIFTMPRPPHFDAGPTLGGRFRGALWAALSELPETPAMAARMALFSLPDPVDLLFRNPPLQPDRNSPLPFSPSRPFRILTACDKGRITLTVRLFGPARQHQRRIEAACLIALTTNGISVAPLAPARHRFAEVAMVRDAPPWPEEPEEGTPVRLIFTSPTRLASGANFRMEVQTLVSSIVGRIHAVGAWSHLPPPMDRTDFNAAVASAEIQDMSLKANPILSHSNRIDRRTMFTGMTGALTLTGLTHPLRQCLPAIEIIGLGAHTSRGFGSVAALPYSG